MGDTYVVSRGEDMVIKFKRSRKKAWMKSGERLFPIGIHPDIDLTIIRLLDYQSLTTLVALDLPARVRALIYENIDYIKANNSDNSELGYEIEHQAYPLGVRLITKNQLTMFKRLNLGSGLIHDISFYQFTDDTNWNGEEQDIIYRLRHNSGNILGLLSVLDDDEIISFVENITPLGEGCEELNPRQIEMANSILKFFQNISEYTDLDLSKQSEIAIKRIRELSQKMRISEIHMSLGKFLDNLYK